MLPPPIRTRGGVRYTSCASASASSNSLSDLELEDVLEVVAANYDFTPTSFRNGEVTNEQGENEGSCKLLCWAQLRGLTKQETLACFGRHYRELDPNGSDHANIRQLMVNGLGGVTFLGAQMPLTPK